MYCVPFINASNPQNNHMTYYYCMLQMKSWRQKRISNFPRSLSQHVSDWGKNQIPMRADHPTEIFRALSNQDSSLSHPRGLQQAFDLFYPGFLLAMLSSQALHFYDHFLRGPQLRSFSTPGLYVPCPHQEGPSLSSQHFKPVLLQSPVPTTTTKLSLIFSILRTLTI